MTDKETIKLFCTEWLLQNDCSRGTNCIFLHANLRDVTLCDDLTQEEVFVKGSYNQGWQKKSKNKRGRPRNTNFNTRQNSNRDFSHRYGTRNNQKVNKQNGFDVPSTSSSSVTTNTSPGVSTGACKKVINKNTKYFPRTFNSNASESDDENSRNLPNVQKSRNKSWIKSCEFVPSNIKNIPQNSSNINLKYAKNQDEAAKCPVNDEPVSKQVQRDSAVASAVADSQEKVCGICFETIMQKNAYERRFGILPNCNHCFCLACIRKWRQAKQFENNIIRACPECRVTSDFVCPSTYWVETVEAKQKLILSYKQALSKKDCKYFKKGSGSCPFGNKCFYLHALNNGNKIDVGPPPSTRFDSEFSDEMDLIEKLVLLEYLQNDFVSYSDFDDDEVDNDDDDLFDYMFWDSDDDVCIF